MIFYKITNNITHLCYIGHTSKTLKIRWSWHLSKVRNNSLCLIHVAIREYGERNFSIEEISESENSKAAIDYLEPKYIDEYNTLHPNGYNDSTGGVGGGQGTKRTTTQREHMSNVQKGISNIGNIASDETRQRMRESSLRKDNPGHSGYTHSDETKQLISKLKSRALNPSAKVWKVTRPNGEIIITNDRKAFCKQFGLKLSTVVNYTLLDKKIKGYYFEEYHEPRN